MPVLTLPRRCDRAATAAMVAEFVAASGRCPIEIDGSAVTQVGQAMLQLLVSARRSGKGAVITASPALLDAAELAGLATELFGDQQP